MGFHRNEDVRKLLDNFTDIKNGQITLVVVFKRGHIDVMSFNIVLYLYWHHTVGSERIVTFTYFIIKRRVIVKLDLRTMIM